eukprot:CAMPEP_0196764476 /NCGR_PEP_ID=MMETSP1095-20130614/6238_1 /TAXON_ID=96789 ORGANISM="Chromulina nebulosa, Strain UTEXLB2642" /NCGR_SAMPLE_ID=MMETSP1095 /ASSEMBLY_ACC=CAM_ASM_000446 /LENGTH=514 /DNA_ID=CAMNT_0042120201 /DNA_START=1445 /DNA_END=2989 /DNA_ORIENTATION=+
MNDQVLTNAYNIHKETKIPSVYGKNTLTFTSTGNNANIILSSEASYFMDITNEINDQCKSKRPVLVFFETIGDLENYHKSPAAQQNKHRTKILTEKETETSKVNLIRLATSANTITLLTKEYGRGIDFIVYDKTVNDAGGPHVIQTFFSHNISEEIQIKGRTARQGGKGSYSMVLLSSKLEALLILPTGPDSVEYMVNNKEYGTVLNKMRAQFSNNKRGSLSLQVGSCMPQHEMSLNFINALTNKDINKCYEHLNNFNKCPENYLVTADTKVLVLMDATGSMSSCITNTKNAVGEMFKRARKVLETANFRSIFEIQFAVYRNYNAPIDMIIEWSEWTSDPTVLYAFIDKIQPRYGMGNEAVEIGLWHVNREMEYDSKSPINRIVLIGDQPPNTLEEVKYRREKNRGENYWMEKKLGPATTYLDQLDLIKQKNKDIIINSFYLNGNNAEKVFTEIAESTGGKCQSLDVTDVSIAADKLLEDIAKNILDAINKNSKTLPEGHLVGIYNQLFKAYDK